MKQTLEFIGHVYDLSEEYDIPYSWLANKKNQRDISKFNNWKKFLFSPWSDTSFGYSIERREDLLWQCTFNVVVYDDVEASIYSLAETPEKALKDLRTILMKLKLGVYNS